MKFRIMGLALSLCLVLSSCGGQDGGGQASLLAQATGWDDTQTLLVIGGREVPGWRYLYWLAGACDQVQEEYTLSGAELDWQAAVGTGTLADEVKDQALRDTALYTQVELWAEQYGYTLTQEDQASLEQEWQEQTAGGEEMALRQLESQGLTRERAEELASVGLLYAGLYRMCQTEGSPLAPTQEELQAFAVQQGIVTVDRIFYPAGEDADAARAQAEKAFSALNGAADQAEVFTALASAAGDPAGPRTITVGDGMLDPELEEAAAALEEGQCSGILETEAGFSILRRLSDDSQELAGAWFDVQLQNAAADVSVETGERYDQLDPAEFYTALERLREQPEQTE